MEESRRGKLRARDDEVVRLHLADYSYREISEVIGISQTMAHKIVVKKLGEERKHKMNLSK